MKTEIEAKFIDIDIDEVRQKLRDIDAVCETPMRLMRRALIEEARHKQEHSFLRIRDEGDKTTLTFKRRHDPMGKTIDNVKEIEVVVSDFDTTVELFKEAGWEYKTFQESRRETWRLGEVEVVIDEWPWLNPMIEIEAETEQEVRGAAETLGFLWSEAVFGSVDVVYDMEFPNMQCRGIIDVKEARFENPSPEQFGTRKASH